MKIYLVEICMQPMSQKLSNIHCKRNQPWHFGVRAFHCNVDKHVALREPIILQPGLHLNRIRFPTSKESPNLRPSFGLPGSGHALPENKDIRSIKLNSFMDCIIICAFFGSFKTTQLSKRSYLQIYNLTKRSSIHTVGRSLGLSSFNPKGNHGVTIRNGRNREEN